MFHIWTSLIFLFLIVNNSFCQVVSSFNSNVQNGCSPLVVNFTNTSQNATNCIWDFGNGIQSTLNNPSTTYLNPGFYTVKLISQNATDIDSIISVNYIQVFDLPTASFTISTISNCLSDNFFSFTNTSMGANSYTWDFNDGNTNTNTTTNPNHQYSLSGSYNITLVATNSSGCSHDTTIGPIYVYPNPILSASVDKTILCDSNSTVNFTGLSSNTSVSNWSWKTGDGNIHNTVLGNFAYNYNATGTYSPTLLATSSNGCKDSIAIGTLNIVSLENYSISSSSNSGCPPLVVDFNLTPSQNIQQISWNFGDGNSINTAQNPTHTFISSGIFSVSATITDTNGCIQQKSSNNNISVSQAPVATTVVTNNVGCPPLNVQFDVTTAPSNTILLDFGDATVSSSNFNSSYNYVNSGTYYPTLQITNVNGCQSNYNLDTVQAGLDLTNFIASPLSGCAILEVDFTNSAPPSATSFHWDFGDGNTSTNPNPTHIYDTIGEYTVTFSCSDNSGCSSTLTIQNMITTYGEDDVILPNPDTILACSPYTFVADAGNIGNTYWNWDFGDGNFASGSNATNNYTQPGLYTVLLNADAPNGCMYNITNYSIIKIDDNLDIDLNFTIDNTCGNGFFNVVNNSTGVVDHLWEMGDGSVFRTADVNHSFNTENSYIITYQGLSPSGCIVTQNIPIIFNCDSNNNPIQNSISILIEKDSTSPDSLITGPLIDPITNNVISQTCGPELINLSSPFNGANQYFWDFGDGNTSISQNPTHLYQNAGTFNLTHYATYPNGDIDTLIINSFVNQYILDAEITLMKTELCNEANYQFSNLSSNISSWTWTLDSTIISSQNNGSITLPLNDSVSILKLKIEDNYGCINEEQKSIFLYQPLALIDQDTFVCTQSSIALFEASVIGDPIHSWNLGDGTTLGPDTTVYHTYNQNGFYNIELSLNNQGCIRTINLDTIEVYQPNASFIPLSSSPICHMDSLLFEAIDKSYFSYNWFDGNSLLSSGDSVWIQFDNPGKRQITLSITDRGCTNQITTDTILVNKANAGFSLDQLNGCLPIDVNFQDTSTNPVSWIWSFGDGNTSISQNPSHQYLQLPSDSVNLVITDVNGCMDSLKSTIINQLNAEFTASDTLSCIHSTITFTGLDNVVNNWLWDLGDGTSSTDSIVNHTYTSPGYYEVSLIVSDGQGCNDTVIKNNYIEIQEVTANFSYNSPSSCPPILTVFTNNSQNATNFIWDFGDNSTSIVTEPSHIYANAGTYFVSLIASNNIGCTDTLNYPDSLYVPGPQLNYSVDLTTGCDSLTVQILDSSMFTVNYSFDFGDGTIIQSSSATHSYNNVGNYLITLVGEDASGCQSFLTLADTIRIYPSPSINITLSDSNFCLNEVITPNNTTTQADFHLWTYGLQSYSISSPSITIDQIGQNNIKYIAENTAGGCVDSVEIAVVGHQIPDVSIINPGVLCTNVGLFTLQSLNMNQLGTLNWVGNGVTNQGIFDPTLLSADSTLIRVTHDSICSSYDSLYIIIDNPPDPTILTNDTVYCYGSSILQPVTLNSGGTWLGINADPITGAITAILDTGFYTYNYILSNLNCQDTAAYSINILHQNDASITHPGTICDNLDTVTLASIDPGGIWNGMQINPFTGTIDINALGNGNYNYIYSIIGTCPDSDTLNLDIFEFIEASINVIPDFCEGTDSVQITSNTNIGSWSGLQNTHFQDGLFLISNVNDGTYEVYYTITGNCPDSDTASITLLPQPDIDVLVTQTLPCVSYQIDITNQSANLANEDYAWFVNDSLYYSNFNEPFFLLDTGFYTISTSAVNLFGCRTDSIILDSVQIYDTTALAQASIIRSTVIENSKIYTEWNSVTQTFNPLLQSQVLRSENGEPFQFIGTVDSSTHFFIDDNVDVFNSKYEYIVVSRNCCQVNSSNSNYGSSVLLKYQRINDYETKLYWNFYQEWLNGAKEYKVQKLNENNIWETISVTNSISNEIIIDQ